MLNNDVYLKRSFKQNKKHVFFVVKIYIFNKIEKLMYEIMNNLLQENKKNYKPITNKTTMTKTL